jgi:hypothetical protein
MSRKIYCALVHYPIVDKHGALVSTSVTNLDIHDISRSARTYGLDGYYIVTPIESQHWLVNRILTHWNTGWGSTYNENRKEALAQTHCTTDIGTLADSITEAEGQAPVFVITSAKRYSNSISYAAMRELLDQDGPPVVLLFGTGWGLHPEIIAEADLVLEPIFGRGSFNHLSVRAAAAIIFDRLLGSR